ncbi:PREDICTED: interleukin-6 [Condylura cristata]|uniref:interleukin-6 n=1 Tax=Condylura cristata TaxID=143302 RepID=UPI000334408A|nr:PREDICTED: interleukin-6 [Condylura cristata]
MSFLSTSVFSPIAFSLGLLLVMATAFPTPTPLGEDSKDVTLNRLPFTSSNKTEELIKYILIKISALKNEMCKKYDKCDNNKEALAENNLNLPKMTAKDGCFQSGFNKETCLIRITTGLLDFQIYLEYLQYKFEGDKENAEAVLDSTKALSQILRQKVKNPDALTNPNPTANARLLDELKSQNEWLKNTTIHLTLQSLEDFLQFGLRAIRIM